MKKKILISLLIVSFFNYIGCYSYYTLTEEEINAGIPKGDEDIKLILNNESEIECQPLVGNISDNLYYLKVENPERIVIGTGELIDEQTKTRSSFKGIIMGDMIDSSRIFIVNSEEFCVYWTKDNKRLAFKKGDYIDILPEQGIGYYILEPAKPLQKISFDQVKEIQVSKINWYITGSLIGLYVALGVAVGLLFGDLQLPQN